MENKKYEKFYEETGELKEKRALYDELLTPIPSSFPTVERLVSFMPTQHTGAGEITNPPPEFVVLLDDLNDAIEACDNASDVLKVVNNNLAKIESEISSKEAERDIVHLNGKKKLLIRAGQNKITKILGLKNIE